MAPKHEMRGEIRRERERGGDEEKEREREREIEGYRGSKRGR